MTRRGAVRASWRLTPQHWSKIRHREIAERLNHKTDFREYPLSTLEEVVALLDKEKNDADG